MYNYCCCCWGSQLPRSSSQSYRTGKGNGKRRSISTEQFRHMVLFLVGSEERSNLIFSRLYTKTSQSSCMHIAHQRESRDYKESIDGWCKGNYNNGNNNNTNRMSWWWWEWSWSRNMCKAYMLSNISSPFVFPYFLCHYSYYGIIFLKQCVSR